MPDEGYADALIAAEATEQLRSLSAGNKPFFLAVGFYKPHLPHNAPKRYWDMYPAETVGLAANTRPPEGSDPDVCLHRLRHTVATVLVGQGDILAAQARLGHRDASTTLRIYSHALPLHDADTAAQLDELYR